MNISKNYIAVQGLAAMLWMIVSLQASAQSSAVVTFHLSSPYLQESNNVYITGGISELGNWDPGDVQMKCIGSHTWEKTISIKAPMTIEYKYTLGSWEKEGVDTSGNPFPNFRAKISHDTVISNHIMAWGSGRKAPLKHTVTGTLRQFPAMKGKGLKDRDILVWLPPDYDSNTSKHYPVVYFHDGQNVFDAATSAFGAEWRADEIADSLIRAGKIGPVILVGICNTPDRGIEYAPGKLGNAYMEFLVKKLKPFIDSAFRTMPDARHTVTCGASMGGTIAFMLSWYYPNVIGNAICMSSPFYNPPLDLITPVNKSSGKRNPAFFFIYNGGVSLDGDLEPGNEKMVAALKNKGYAEGRDFVFAHDPSASHFETYWSKHLPAALIRCLGTADKQNNH